MNRIKRTFRRLKKNKKKAFIVYITAGYPSLSATEKIVFELEKSGVDIIEIGVPFSDPMADGLTIQKSSERALKKGTTLKKILRSIKNIRKKSDIPIALMSYLNPLYCYGLKKFVTDAVKCGVDGIILPDLPPEEAEELEEAAIPAPELLGVNWQLRALLFILLLRDLGIEETAIVDACTRHRRFAHMISRSPIQVSPDLRTGNCAADGARTRDCLWCSPDPAVHREEDCHGTPIRSRSRHRVREGTTDGKGVPRCDAVLWQVRRR